MPTNDNLGHENGGKPHVRKRCITICSSKNKTVATPNDVNWVLATRILQNGASTKSILQQWVSSQGWEKERRRGEKGRHKRRGVKISYYY
ncbi:hypothetical protein SLA2020_050470 [Shorea laevis]